MNQSPFSPSASTSSKVLQGFQARIYRETARVERPIAHLMTWFLDRRNLDAAWERVRSADGANTPGLDGATCKSIQPMLGTWLNQLSEDLYRGEYRPSAPRWVEIPKSKPGQFRKLGILTIRDRVVHAALKQILEPILEPTFLPCSYGFRAGQSVPGALADALFRLDGTPNKSEPFRLGVSLDVATCFDTIDVEILKEQIQKHVQDEELCRLLTLLLRAGSATERRWWWRRSVGLVQGGALSPLLCNLYLHPIDQKMTLIATELSDQVHFLRYADNFLLLAADHKAGHGALAAVQKQLVLLRQKPGEPNPTFRPLTHGLDWLGVRLRPRPFLLEGRPTFGYVIPETKVHGMLEKLAEITSPPNENIDADVFNLERWIVTINRQLRDWRQAYLFADNSGEVFRTLDDYARLRFGRLLAQLTGERFHRVRKLYRHKLPRGFWTWQVNNTQLTVLSSLAPHSPGLLTFKPGWMSAFPAAKPTPDPHSPEQHNDEREIEALSAEAGHDPKAKPNGQDSVETH